ncbi:phosphoethanolamine transferase [Flavobacterium sp. J27]|uniref:phosphoethanolamine transferase n=1 Tax=Flavobacterium sp. J27 TaxID=2060419 RepID=UPI0013EE51A3|nr:phosphoethanolamine transferase [Flavobacterium sp. J27]
MLEAIQDYKLQMISYNNQKFNKTSDYFKNVTLKKDSIPETYVLVIGESTTKNHMELYDYYRNTTPLLHSISNELLVYNNVICPNTHTLTALEKVLTLGTTDNLDLKYKGNLLQLFNQAGFTTYWISNQKPTGIWDNFITGIANSSHHKFFYNISDNKSPYDEVLFETYKSVLKEKTSKKLIILHLMGTHLSYKDRYPNSFNVFVNKPKTKFNTKEVFETINNYDNSILYQDYIWFSIIELLKRENQKAAVLCLSDHGEEVYESIDFFGHTETKGTKSMYEIPFLLWLSDKKKDEKNNLVFDVKRRYCSEDLIYSMADLAGIHFTAFHSKKSILNVNYMPSKKVVIKILEK